MKLMYLLIPPLTLLAHCQIDTLKKEKQTNNPESKEYCPLAINVAEDGPDFLAAIDKDWMSSTKLVVPEDEGLGQGIYRRQGKRISASDLEVASISYLYPNTTQATHSSRLSLADFSFASVEVSEAETQGDHDGYRIVLFHDVENNGNQYKCGAIALKLDAEGEGSDPALLMTGMSFMTGISNAPAPQGISSGEFFKDLNPKSYRNGAYFDSKPEQGVMPIEDKPRGERLDPSEWTIDNAPFYSNTFIEWTNDTESNDVKATLTCADQHYYKSWRTETDERTLRSSLATSDLTRCDKAKIEVNIKQPDFHYGQTYSTEIDHRTLWLNPAMAESESRGLILLNVSDFIKDEFLQGSVAVPAN